MTTASICVQVFANICKSGKGIGLTTNLLTDAEIISNILKLIRLSRRNLCYDQCALHQTFIAEYLQLRIFLVIIFKKIEKFRGTDQNIDRVKC